MNIDSTKLSLIPKQYDYSLDKYNQQILIKKDKEQTIKYMLHDDYKELGLKNIIIHPYTNEVITEFSGKILKDNYLEGINSNTIEQVHSVIEPFIGCSLDDVLDGIVLTCDITENIVFDTEEEKEFAIQSLRLGKSNIAFKVDDYTKKGKCESMIFTGRQVSYKNRQIYYDKGKELMLSKNKEIMKHLYKRKDYISRIMRVEQNITRAEQMRNTLHYKRNQINKKVELLDLNRRTGGLHNEEEEARALRTLRAINNTHRPSRVSLRTLLENKNNANPLLERHQIIMKYANQVNIFDMFDNVRDAIEYFGYEGILSQCNNSPELVIDFFRKLDKKYNDKGKYLRTGGNFYNYKNKFLKHIANKLEVENIFSQLEIESDISYNIVGFSQNFVRKLKNMSLNEIEKMVNNGNSYLESLYIIEQKLKEVA